MPDIELRAVVYVSWGLWVAKCPRPDCLGAEHFGHAPITGVVGGLTQAGFRCGRCGLVCRAEWPTNADDIWRLLAMRPLVETRTWMPGEELESLLVENVAHGLIAPDGLPGGLLIVNGHLTGAVRELATAGAQRAIGG